MTEPVMEFLGYDSKWQDWRVDGVTWGVHRSQPGGRWFMYRTEWQTTPNGHSYYAFADGNDSLNGVLVPDEWLPRVQLMDMENPDT